MPQRPIHGWENEIDGFWNLSDMVPKKMQSPPRRPARPQEPAEVEVSRAPAPHGEAIPPRNGAREMPQSVREYVSDARLIDRVRILPWPTEFSFYSKFRADAVRHFERTHEACEYVYFFSYMPQYDQMTGAQSAYYFYWRSEVRRGHFLKTDNSYLFLYIYEILNLPDLVPPAEGAKLLCALWSNYRASFRYLDKYIGEWLCDYCLIHRVEPDHALLAPILAEECGRLTFPEFYLSGEDVPFSLVASVSAYDYRKSKYYADHAEAFDRHIPAAVSRAVCEVVLPYLSDYGITPMKLTKDSFSGAVACRGIKFKLEITCYPLKRAYPFKQLAANLIKFCENQLRAACGIKSRFSPSGIDERLRAAVNGYFDEVYPDRYAKRRATAEAEPAYLSLYEPKQTGPASIEAALQIEREAWDTAELLEVEERADGIAPARIEPIESAPKPPSWTAGGVIPSGASDDETVWNASGEAEEEAGFDGFLSALDGMAHEALASALRGDFAAYCRAHGQMTGALASRINEAAMNAVGDMILEEDGTVVPDYEEELFAALGRLCEKE